MQADRPNAETGDINPYASPTTMVEAPSQAWPLLTSVLSLAAAIACGFACYWPYPGFRGALFCIYPGVANRSAWSLLKGVGLGFVVDIAVTIVWMMLAGVWEPRWGGFHYNLALRLPPGLTVMSHVGSPMPNSLKFGIGLVLWMTAMFAIWISLTKGFQRLSGKRSCRKVAYCGMLRTFSSLMLAGALLCSPRHGSRIRPISPTRSGR